jgi:hypothetical protein
LVNHLLYWVQVISRSLKIAQEKKDDTAARTRLMVAGASRGDATVVPPASHGPKEGLIKWHQPEKS